MCVCVCLCVCVVSARARVGEETVCFTLTTAASTAEWRSGWRVGLIAKRSRDRDPAPLSRRTAVHAARLRRVVGQTAAAGGDTRGGWRHGDKNSSGGSGNGDGQGGAVSRPSSNQVVGARDHHWQPSLPVVATLGLLAYANLGSCSIRMAIIFARRTSPPSSGG